MIKFSEKDRNSREDSDPEDVRLAERQAHKTEEEKPQVPPDLLDLALIRADQRVEAHQYRESRGDIGIV